MSLNVFADLTEQARVAGTVRSLRVDFISLFWQPRINEYKLTNGKKSSVLRKEL